MFNHWVEYRGDPPIVNFMVECSRIIAEFG
jgi:hypothetical protein